MTTGHQRTTPALPAKTRAYRRLDVQGLRGVAVLMVVAYHADFPLRGGFTGVDVFFVISGYVITSLIMRELSATGRLRLGQFYLRRGLRLLPALALTSLVTTLVGAVLLSPLGTQQQSAGTGVAASFWASNIALYTIASDYFSVHMASNPFLHTWSLGVEEQFYLFFPALLLGGWKLGRRFRRPGNIAMAWVIGVVTVSSFALSLAACLEMVTHWLPNSSSFAFYLSPARAWEFGAGALIACGWQVDSLPMRLRSAASWGGLGLIVIGGFTISGSGTYPGWAALVPVAGTAAVIAAGMAGPIGSSRLLTVRWLVYVGDISYSWYLWHWPFVVFTRRIWPTSGLAVVAAVILSLGMAAVSSRYVEQRFRRPRPRFTWASARLLAAAVAVPALACSALYLGALYHWGNDSVAEAARQLLARPVGYRTCLGDAPISGRDLNSCTWGSDRDGPPIYLIGDSNAQQYTEALIGAAESEDRPLVVATMGGCPLVDVRTRSAVGAAQEVECARFVADALEWLERQPPGSVILAAAGEGIEDADISYRVPGQDWAVNPDDKAVAWQEGLSRAIDAIQDGGHQVIMVHVAPHFPGVSRPWWHPVECANVTLFDDPAKCGMTLPLASIELGQRREFVAEALAAQESGALALDLRPTLCADGQCSTNQGEFWLYRDGLHISPDESARLGPVFAEVLTRVSPGGDDA